MIADILILLLLNKKNCKIQPILSQPQLYNNNSLKLLINKK